MQSGLLTFSTSYFWRYKDSANTGVWMGMIYWCTDTAEKVDKLCLGRGDI